MNVKKSPLTKNNDDLDKRLDDLLERSSELLKKTREKDEVHKKSSESIEPKISPKEFRDKSISSISSQNTLPSGFDENKDKKEISAPYVMTNYKKSVNVKLFIFLSIIPIVNIWAFYRIKKLRLAIRYLLATIIVNVIISVVFDFDNILDIPILNMLLGISSDRSINEFGVLVRTVVPGIMWFVGYLSLMRTEVRNWNDRYAQ